MPGERASPSDYRGRRVIVNYWATWCAPCRAEMAGLQRLSDALEARGIAVVGVNVDADGNLAREFVLAHGIRFAQFADPGMRHARAAHGIRALPHTFAVNAEGETVARVVGARDWPGAEGAEILRGAFRFEP